MSDLAIAIGIDSSEALEGRDRIISLGGDLEAMYARLKRLSAEYGSSVFGASGSQTAGAGMEALAQAIVKTRSAASAFWSETEAGSRKIMAANQAVEAWVAGLKRAEQAAKETVSSVTALDRAQDVYAANRMRDMQRIRDAQTAQNASYMASSVSASSLIGVQSSGASARASADVFNAHFAQQEASLAAQRAIELQAEQRISQQWEAQLQRESAALQSIHMQRKQRDAEGWEAQLQAEANAIRDNANAVQRLTATYAPHVAELQRLRADEARLNELHSAGAISTDVYQQSMTHLQARMKLTHEEFQRMAAGAKMTSGQMQNLSFQINDILSGIAMGQSPMQILTQQGGQVFQIFQQAGIGITGVAVGIAGVAVAATALIAPIARLAEMNQEAKALDISLASVGNTANLTGGYLQALAAQTARVSVSSRADVTAAFKALSTDPVGRSLSASQMQSLTMAAEGYAFVTGKTLPEATIALTKAVTGGFESMTKLSAQYPLATRAELENLRTMSQHGDIAGMLGLEIDLLNRKFGSLAEQGASESQKAIHGLSSAWDEFMTSVSHSDVIVLALREITNTMKGLSDEIRNAPAQLLALLNPSTQLVELAKLNLRGRGWSQFGESPKLSMPMPPPLPKQTAPNGRALDGSSLGTAEDAFSAKTDAILSAARAQAAAYDMVGMARQKALVSAQFDQQIVSAGADLEKVAELRAQKSAALMMVDAQARGQTNDTIDALRRHTAAQQALNAAIFRGYEAQKQAEIENAVAEARFANPNMTPAQESELRRNKSRDLEAARRGAEGTYLRDLELQAANENKIADARLRGTEASRLQKIENEARSKSQLQGFDYDETYTQLKAISDLEQRQTFYAQSRSMNPKLQYQDEIDGLERLKQSKEGAMVTDQQYADAYFDARQKMLSADKDWRSGATASLERYAHDAQNYGSLAARATTSSLNAMENALVAFSMKTATASQAFKTMAGSIISDLIRMQVQAQVTGPLSSGLSGMFSNLFGGGGVSYSPNWNSSVGAGAPYDPQLLAATTPFADGGIMTQWGKVPLRTYSDGGIANSPQAAIFGEGSVPEAYVPVPSGKIPVEVRGPQLSSRAQQGGTAQTTQAVHITTYVEAGANMADVESAVTRGIQAAAPHLITAAVKQSVPMSVSAVQAKVKSDPTFAGNMRGR